MSFGTFTQPRVAGRNGLTKSQLKDQLAVFKLTALDHNIETKFGPTTRATAEVLIVEGQDAGTYSAKFMAFGNLAKQMEPIGVGNTALGRVIYGVAGTKTYWGIDFSVDENDTSLAERAIAAHLEDASGPKTLAKGL